jgi:phosphoribosyl 1,2-cyclic phosphate phosphodiesterase
MISTFRGADIWVVDALRRHPHPSHAHLAKALDWAHIIGAGRTILTHMDQSMDYRELCAELPAGVEPGFDGMEILL